MEHFTNKSESFYREIRSIEIYNASDVSYIDNFQGIFPDSNLCVYKFDITTPESFTPKILTKTQNGNYFTDIDISFSLLDLSKDNIDKCYEYFNKKNFSIVLISNIEKMLLGNEKEKLKVEFIDGKKNDASGSDECFISITGDTIINPKIQNL